MRPGSRGPGAGSMSPQRPGTSSTKQRERSETLSNVAARLASPMYISDRALLPEQETIQFVETLLALPAVSGITEDGLVSTATSTADGLVTDPDFPPTTSSLYPNSTSAPESLVSNRLVWRRVAGALYLPSGALPQLLQGCLSDAAFLGALAAVGCYPDLLLDLIVSDEQAHAGCYTLQFYKHGCWHHVCIDNYLPCVEGEEKLAFACSAHVGELWPSIIEKGYAKVHGSFSAITGGSVTDCLTDLTGGVTTKIKLDATNGTVTAGHLWHQLSTWLSEGAIIACKSKPTHTHQLHTEEGSTGDTHSPFLQGDPDEGAGGGDGQGVSAEEAVQGYGGILQHMVYSVLECRQLDRGRVRLLRVHCPWPCPGGLWQGAWAVGAPEWDSSPEVQALAAQPLDAACFWINVNDFARAFNRLYVCRRFPSSWQQLTLHSGWKGPSAGGPYFKSNVLQLQEHKGVACVSSTWCCNPQFQLTVRKPCEVVVAVGQVDPRVEHRGHLRKNLRKRSIGMMVVTCSSDTAGRVWSVASAQQPSATPGSPQVLAEVPLTSGRELVTSFRAEPGVAYIVVPYTGRPGEESAFVLRAYGGAPLEVEQLPSPLSLVLGGSWSGPLAGGPETASTWGSNPQYMISAPCRTKVVISACRLDVRYAVVKPHPAPDQAVGLYLCHADRSVTDGLTSHKTAIKAPSDVAAQSGFLDIQEAVLVATLEPATPYVLVPSLASAATEAPFELRLMSAVPLELVPLPELCSCVLQGAWTSETAGGCDLTPTWRKNPRYLMLLGQSCTLKVTLTRVTPANSNHQPSPSSIEDMIGFYILQASDNTGAVKGDMRRAMLAESTFSTTSDSTGEYELQATQTGVPYIIIPCKYGAGKTGRFRLAVSATAAFTLTQL